MLITGKDKICQVGHCTPILMMRNGRGAKTSLWNLPAVRLLPLTSTVTARWKSFLLVKSATRIKPIKIPAARSWSFSPMVNVGQAGVWAKPLAHHCKQRSRPTHKSQSLTSMATVNWKLWSRLMMVRFARIARMAPNCGATTTQADKNYLPAKLRLVT